MDVERSVASHYSHGGLEKAILAALRAAGKDPDRLAAADLAEVDEFHLGWRAATAALIADLSLNAGSQVLDMGSGIGGPARHMAEACGCRVTGIDLTPEFVEVATALTVRCGLADRVAFRQGSALALPFPAASFGAATLIHVGMNIADKAGLFAEASRVLRAGGRFGIYDIMRVGPDELPYPMPWAATAETSFVETPAHYRALLAAAGFDIEAEHDRRDLALQAGHAMRQEIAANGPPPLGLHVLMGPAAPERFGNVMAALQRGTIAPIAMIARAR